MTKRKALLALYRQLARSYLSPYTDEDDPAHVTFQHGYRDGLKTAAMAVVNQGTRRRNRDLTQDWTLACGLLLRSETQAAMKKQPGGLWWQEVHVRRGIGFLAQIRPDDVKASTCS